MSDHEALIAEAKELVESWDRRGSWTPDSPIGMVARLVVALEPQEAAGYRRGPVCEAAANAALVEEAMRWPSPKGADSTEPAAPPADIIRRLATTLAAASSEPPRVALVTSGRQSGKTSRTIDALLDRANERGIAVEIIEPKPKITDQGLIDLWWKTCSDEWAIPEYLMIAFGRAAIKAAGR